MVHQQKHPEEAKGSRTEGEKEKSRSETAAALGERGDTFRRCLHQVVFLIQRSWKGKNKLDPKRRKRLLKKQ